MNRTMVLLLCAVCIFWYTAGSGSAAATPADFGFTDAKLMQQITVELARQGLELTPDALSEIRELSLSGCGITSLEGMELLTNLHTLDLSSTRLGIWNPCVR